MTQAEALRIMKTGVNIYLTGSAGSGKTYVLNQYIEWLREHDISVAVTASTGIAATHMNGMTIHGFAGIGIRDSLSEYDLEFITQKQYLAKRFERTKVLIIDEVSMLHARTLDMVDTVCKAFKRNELPFGGLQVILSGDFFQLPPISKGAPNPNDMVIYSKAWAAMKPAICYLTESHRQEDDSFLEILNAIRSGEVEEMHFEQLQERINVPLDKEFAPTKLYTHNADVDAINLAELNKIEGVVKKYEMVSRGRDVLVEILKKSTLAHDMLSLKVGAQVMFVKNNFEMGYVNGTRGTVTSFLPDNTPVVKLLDGRTIYVPYESWAIEEDGKIKAEVSQLPLRLAWAITIHKSQGMSLDSAEIDLSKTFVYGMGYVALSRVRTLSGIRLIGIGGEALRVDPNVLEFDINLRKESRDNISLFGKLTNTEHKKLEDNFITRSGGSVKVIPKALREKKAFEAKVPTHMQTKALLEQGNSILEIATERGMAQGTIVGHIEELLQTNAITLEQIEELRPPKKHITLIKDAIKELEEKIERSKGNKDLLAELASENGHIKLSPIKSILDKSGNHLTFEQIRIGKLFV